MFKTTLKIISILFLGLTSCDSVDHNPYFQDENSDNQGAGALEYAPEFEKTARDYKNYQQLKFLFDSLGYYEAANNQSALFQTRIKLANLLRQTGNYRYGIDLLKTNLASENPEVAQEVKGQTFNGLSAIYFELYMHQQQTAYLDSCWHYAEKTHTVAQQTHSFELEVDALTLKGAVMLHRGDFPAAKALLNEAYQLSIEHLPNAPLAVMTNLAWAALQTHDYESAMRWNNQCYEDAKKAGSSIFVGISLKIKADIYEALGMHDKAVKASEQLREHQENDDILFQSLMMKELVVQQEMKNYKQTMLGLYKEKYFLIRLTFVFVFISIVLVLVSVGVYKLLRQQKRIREKERELTLSRQKEDALIIKNSALELAAKEAEQQALEARLEVQDQELVYQSLKQIYFSQLTGVIKEKFGPFRHKLGRKKDQEQFDSTLEEVCREASHDPLSEFEQIFLQMHSGFYEKLIEINPEISRSELQLCALLRMNLPSKEIASLLFLSLSTVDQKRHQIRKKLGIESNQNLNNFLINL